MKILDLIKKNIDFANPEIDEENNKIVMDLFDDEGDTLLVLVAVYDEVTEGDGYTEKRDTYLEVRDIHSIMLNGEEFYCDIDEINEIISFLDANLQLY